MTWVAVKPIAKAAVVPAYEIPDFLDSTLFKGFIMSKALSAKMGMDSI